MAVGTSSTTLGEHTLADCIRAWRQRQPLHDGLAAPTHEQEGDRLLSRGGFEAAIEAYAQCEAPTEQVRAKHGWCLAVVERFDEAGELLTVKNCGNSSAELAILAVILAGGWNRTRLHGGFGQKGDAARAASKQVVELVQRALQHEQPDYIAFLAFKELADWHVDREAALTVAERALQRFTHPELVEWHALLQRTLGRPDSKALDRLLEHMPDRPWRSYLEQTFEMAVAVGRYDDAGSVLAAVGAQLDADDPSQTLEPIGLMLLQSYLDLRRALDADPGAAQRGLMQLSKASVALRDLAPAHSRDGLVQFASKLRLALAVFVDDAEAIRGSAEAVIADYLDEVYPSDYSPGMALISVAGLIHEADFGTGYRSGTVVGLLDDVARKQWELLHALRVVMFDDPGDDQAARVTISAYGLAIAPGWAESCVVEVLLEQSPPDALNAGRALARHCLHEERTAGAHASLTVPDLTPLTASELDELVRGLIETLQQQPDDSKGTGQLLVRELAQDLHSRRCFQGLKQLTDTVVERSDDIDVAFFGALARHELNLYREAQAMYEEILVRSPDYRSVYWNLALIHDVLSDIEGIQRILPTIETHAKEGDKDWIATSEKAREVERRVLQKHAEVDLRGVVQRELATFPALRMDTIEPEELSLLEAASLVALLRACDLDHATWTLAPFDASSLPYEPTNRFVGTLFELARHGAIQIAESTPMSAYAVRDGRLNYFLGQIHWNISPRTLELQHAIRDLPKDDWPEHWHLHAEALSRDLATEECVAYMEYLAEERGLDAPSRPDARALFRELLEHCSVGKCWYYIYSGVQSANDYRTKYPVSRAQVTAMMLKRTRERGEIAIAKGWETQYDRIRALPRSHLSATLHDVLTGWGDRAFQETIRMLAQS